MTRQRKPYQCNYRQRPLRQKIAKARELDFKLCMLMSALDKPLIQFLCTDSLSCNHVIIGLMDLTRDVSPNPSQLIVTADKMAVKGNEEEERQG